jgi:NAD(P)H-nitrite reductase large subunit
VTDSDQPLSNNQADSTKPNLADGDRGVVLQRDRISYAIAPHIPCGMVTPELLRRIADVAERYHCTALKLTSAERIAMIGLREQDIDAVWRDLEMEPGGLTGDRVRSVRVCPGTDCCKRAQQDSLGIGRLIDAKYHGKPMPAKVKISVSGCPNQCTEPVTKSIGLVGMRSGWDLWVGGSGGAAPRFGTRIAQRCPNDAVLELIDRVMDFYQSNARPRERLHKTLTRLGLDALTGKLGLPRLALPDAGSDQAASAE